MISLSTSKIFFFIRLRAKLTAGVLLCYFIMMLLYTLKNLCIISMAGGVWFPCDFVYFFTILIYILQVYCSCTHISIYIYNIYIRSEFAFSEFYILDKLGSSHTNFKSKPRSQRITFRCNLKIKIFCLDFRACQL